MKVEPPAAGLGVSPGCRVQYRGVLPVPDMPVAVSRRSDAVRRVHQPLLRQRPVALPAAGAAGRQRVRAAAALQQPGLLHVDDPALRPRRPGSPGLPAPQRLRARRPQATQHPVERGGGVL